GGCDFLFHRCDRHWGLLRRGQNVGFLSTGFFLRSGALALDVATIRALGGCLGAGRTGRCFLALLVAFRLVHGIHRALLGLSLRRGTTGVHRLRLGGCAAAVTATVVVRLGLRPSFIAVI